MSVLTKPTGTAIYGPSAADQAYLAKSERIVTPAHAAHLSPQGTLANADRATDIAVKLHGYSLDESHKVGKHEAHVFKAVLGYDRNNAAELDAQIRQGICREPAIPGTVDKFGVQFTVDIPVKGPSGSAIVRTGWIYEGDAGIPRMTTGYVE